MLGLDSEIKTLFITSSLWFIADIKNIVKSKEK